MPRFIACSILCRCSWQYNAALLLRRHSTAKPNSKPSRTFTIDMVSLKFLQHHKHYYSKKYQYLRNCKKRRFCRENLQIRALRKLWGIILRSPKARQLLPPWAQDDIPGGHGGTRGHQGVPGGSRIPPPPNRVIKQQNNDPKPWFKVPKVCPDPKRGGIYSFMRHLGPFGCSKTAISSEKANLWKTGFLEKNHTHTQSTGCNF